MKTLSRLAVLAASLALSVHGAITGQWDFNGNLNATIGQPIFALDGDTQSKTVFGTTTSFGIPDIKGQPAQVLKLPKTVPDGGYAVSSSASPNGEGGFGVNQYTIIMDVLFPNASKDKPRGLFQVDHSGNADFLVSADNGIGALNGPFSGTIQGNIWHRIVFAVDLSATPGTVDKFIDGTKVGTQTVGAALDGPLALFDPLYFWSDDNDETEV